MAELGQSLGLDLADALARDAKLAADFLERTGMSVDKAKAQLDNLALTIGKRVEHLGELLLQHGEAGCIGRNDSLGVLDKVAQLRILFLADGCTRTSLLMVSTMCTGIRMVRAWSAIARVMA